MKKLLIHNPTNEHTKNYRDYNSFWDDLTDELKKHYEITENRYFENAHIDRTKIYLQKRTQEFLEILECEYVIEDLESGNFWILSVADQITGGVLNEQSNPYLKKVLYSQYIPDQIVHHTKENCYKYSPWIYFPQNIVDYDYYYKKRKEKNKFINKLYFKGDRSNRPIINHINSEILSDTKIINKEDYFDDLINYSVCLSIGGAANGNLCYRDIECMALGIPILRFDFDSTLNPSLISNYHYISIPIQLDFPKHNGVLKDRLGNKKHAKLIEDRFYEIINNKIFLEYISKNAKNYYNTYLSKKNRIVHTLNILNIN